jgi:V8-like Glu-specific endopeptidase
VQHLNTLLTFLGICELILYFLTPQGIKKKRATGFFIDSETIATSGHCLYAPDFGHAIAVEAVLGSDEATGGVESRRGQCVVVHWEWFKTYSERYDLAFIRTHRFETAKPIPWMETPFAAKDMQIAVVGIPGRRANPDRHMFQSECPTTIDLPRTAFILEYRLDTLGGTFNFASTHGLCLTHCRK